MESTMRRFIAAILIVLSASVVVVNGSHEARAADANAEADFVARINQLRASRGVAGLQVHSVLVAKARAWADHMAATGCVCHSNLADGVTVRWSKLGENVGRGPSVASILDALVNSAGHYANMVDGAFQWVGVGVSYSGSTMYVAEVFMNGDPPPAPAVNPAVLLQLDWRGRAIAARPQGGFWVLEGSGRVRPFEGAPNYGSPSFGWDIARDIVAMPDGKGYAILDGWGGVHKYGSARLYLAGMSGPYWGWDIGRSIALAPGGNGYAVLDGFGGVHRVGSTPPLGPGLPYWNGWNIARSIAYTPTGGLYLLDGFGTVWATNGAPKKGSPWFGWDIARDIAVWPGGGGYSVIDGFGGVHRFGTAKTSGATKWATLDRWRSISVQGGTYLVIRNDGFPMRV
jgi:hypothetical protein